jgi:hypothetical protein
VTTKKELTQMAEYLKELGMVIVSIDFKNGMITVKPISNKEINAEFISNVWRVLDTAGNLLIRKHKDYGPKNISHSPGGALNGLRVRMHDKVARINHLVDSEVSPSNESLRDSFLDLLNYSAIAMMVLDKTWPEITND